MHWKRETDESVSACIIYRTLTHLTTMLRLCLSALPLGLPLSLSVISNHKTCTGILHTHFVWIQHGIQLSDECPILRHRVLCALLKSKPTAANEQNMPKEFKRSPPTTSHKCQVMPAPVEAYTCISVITIAISYMCGTTHYAAKSNHPCHSLPHRMLKHHKHTHTNKHNPFCFVKMSRKIRWLWQLTGYFAGQRCHCWSQADEPNARAQKLMKNKKITREKERSEKPEPVEAWTFIQLSIPLGEKKTPNKP